MLPSPVLVRRGLGRVALRRSWCPVPLRPRACGGFAAGGTLAPASPPPSRSRRRGGVRGSSSNRARDGGLPGGGPGGGRAVFSVPDQSVCSTTAFSRSRRSRRSVYLERVSPTRPSVRTADELDELAHVPPPTRSGRGAAPPSWGFDEVAIAAAWLAGEKWPSSPHPLGEPVLGLGAYVWYPGSGVCQDERGAGPRRRAFAAGSAGGRGR